MNWDARATVPNLRLMPEGYGKRRGEGMEYWRTLNGGFWEGSGVRDQDSTLIPERGRWDADDMGVGT